MQINNLQTVVYFIRTIGRYATHISVSNFRIQIEICRANERISLSIIKESKAALISQAA